MEFESSTGSFRESSTDPSLDAPDARFSAPDVFGSDASGDGPCQLCGAVPARWESYMWVMSFILLTRHSEYSACLCRSCATKQAVKEQLKSGLLGWWGIPWGLLTIKALWINFRTLIRWSRLGRAGGTALALVALLVPVTAGYLIFNSEEGHARRGGNVVSDEVVKLVEDGHRAFDQGDNEAALKSYRAALAKAPDSSVINYSVALTYSAMGDDETAVRYAGTAESLDGDDVAIRAMYAWLLHSTGREDEARERLEALRGVAPPDTPAALWMADLYEAYGENEERLRVVDSALRDDPGQLDLTTRRLQALVALDRLQEAADVVATAPPEAGERAYYQFAVAEFSMRSDPAAATEALIAGWMDTPYSDHAMAVLAAAAERAGALEASRRRIETYLFDPATPGDAWQRARAWFDEETWTAALDRYLARRPEPSPALLRLTLYDPWTEAAQIRRLTERVDAPDHPLIQYIEGYAYNYAHPGRSLAAQDAAVRAHLARAPDHTLCALRHASLMARLAPSEARPLLAPLREKAADDPALLSEITLLDAQISRRLAQEDSALAEIQDLDAASAVPYSSVGDFDLEVAETAFLAGNQPLLRHQLHRLVAEDREAASHAAALLLRWSDQIARGEAVTYREDVDAWLARYGDDATDLVRSSAQAILGIEGRVPLDERWAMMPPEVRETRDLVALCKRAGETGRVDWDGLQTIAGSPHTYEYAPTLARRVLEIAAAG